MSNIELYIANIIVTIITSVITSLAMRKRILKQVQPKRECTCHARPMTEAEKKLRNVFVDSGYDGSPYEDVKRVFEEQSHDGDVGFTYFHT